MFGFLIQYSLVIMDIVFKQILSYNFGWIMMMTETGQDKTRQATEPWKEYRNKQSEIEGCLYDNDSTTPLWVTN